MYDTWALVIAAVVFITLVLREPRGKGRRVRYADPAPRNGYCDYSRSCSCD